MPGQPHAIFRQKEVMALFGHFAAVNVQDGRFAPFLMAQADLAGGGYIA